MNSKKRVTNSVHKFRRLSEYARETASTKIVLQVSLTLLRRILAPSENPDSALEYLIRIQGLYPSEVRCNLITTSLNQDN